MKIRKNIILNIIILIYILIINYLIPNSKNFLFFLGINLFLISILAILKFKNSGKISWIIGITSLCNICWSNSICFSPYSNAFNWQIKLIDTPENIIMVKSVITFYTVFISTLSINLKYYKKSKNKLLEIKNNSLIFFGGYFILLMCLFTTFSISNFVLGTYIPQVNAYYEYAIVIFLFCWIYSSKNKVYKFLLILYALFYILMGILFGDRSSAFPMIILLLILVNKKEITLINILKFGILGILLGNTIDLFRQGVFQTGFIELLNRGINVNTISYSHYAGVQIIRFANNEFHLMHLLESFIQIFTGGGTSLAQLAKESGYVNSGGGLTSTYFYYWLGYFGTILGGYIFAKVIARIFIKNSKKNIILQICIILFSLRWYIYYPSAFFRTALFIPSLIYLICYFIDKKNLVVIIGD